MTAQVLTHPRFASTTDLSVLVDRGAGLSTDSVLAEMKLPEPAYGERVIGTLSDDELAVFYELFTLTNRLEEMSRDIVGTGFEALAKVVRSAPSQEIEKNLHDALSKAGHGRDFFAVQQRQAMIYSTFYYHLGERMDAHDWRLGIRSKGRVVKIAKR